MRALGPAFSAMKNLAILDLSENELTDESAEELGRHLSSRQELTDVFLSHNKLGIRGAVQIWKKLPEKLSILDLSHNRIGAEDDVRESDYDVPPEWAMMVTFKLSHNQI